MSWIKREMQFIGMPGAESLLVTNKTGSLQEAGWIFPMRPNGSIDAIYADADNADIYLLDKAGKRIVVTDKKGKYLAQYIGDQIAGATGLVVSEADKKIILLTGDKLFSIDIRHI